MSKRSHRKGREELKITRKEKKKQEKILRSKLIAAGHILKPPSAKPNTVSPLETREQERELRADAVHKHIQIIRAQLPTLLRRLKKIPDPRNPKKNQTRVRHINALRNAVFCVPVQLAQRGQ